MSQTAILFPVLALAGWTMAVLLLMPLRIFRSVSAGQEALEDIKLGVASQNSSQATIPNRNFINLLEVPVLFYVLCIILYVTQRADATAVYLAWGYFGLRVVHSCIHLTYNKVLHRGFIYGISNLVVMVILVKALLEIGK